MKEKIKFIAKLINSLPVHLKNWYEFCKNGRNNHVAIYSFGRIYPEDVDYIMKRTIQIVERMDRSTKKYNPGVKFSKDKKIITTFNNAKHEYMA